MSEHVHFDLAEAERQIRSALADNIAAAKAKATDPDDLVLIEAQEKLMQFRVGVSLTLIGWKNDGVDPEIIGMAVGSVLGSIMANLLQNFDETAGDSMFAAISATMYASLFDADIPNLRRRKIKVTGIRGGSA